MRLEKVCIKGFRNFDDTEVIFQKKTLIKSISRELQRLAGLVFTLMIQIDLRRLPK